MSAFLRCLLFLVTLFERERNNETQMTTTTKAGPGQKQQPGTLLVVSHLGGRDAST